ncbi:nicotinate dehydrogenase subunit B [bacterium BMS3Bbin10]|nr:nicotinate dehydrogenase subunit B [bacterium BMS3Bbin10]
MRGVAWTGVLLGILGAFVSLAPVARGQVPAPGAVAPNLKNGETMFNAGGCASCHAAPASAKCDGPKIKDRLMLAGGRCLKTPFGIFYVPNISPDKESGIGGWSVAHFVKAMRQGLSPQGEHYYPAFPYTSYQRMFVKDLTDLKAFLDTLPAVKSTVPDHDLRLPFRLRRTLGIWKWLFLDGKTFQPDPGRSAQLNRGAYLVEGPGHCGECHSPRNPLGGIIPDKKYSGAPNPEGKGIIPNITPHKSGIGDWSQSDIITALETGLTPSFDTFGGTMVKVQENMAKLSGADRAAIAAYLGSLAPIPGSVGKSRNNDGAGKAEKP